MAKTKWKKEKWWKQRQHLLSVEISLKEREKWRKQSEKRKSGENREENGVENRGEKTHQQTCQQWCTLVVLFFYNPLYGIQKKRGGGGILILKNVLKP